MQCTPHCVLTISEQCLASLIVLDSPFSILCVFALSSFVSWVKSIQSADIMVFDPGSKSNKKNSQQDEDDYRTMTTIHNGDLLRGPPLPEAEPRARGWFVHRLIALAQEELDSTGDRWRKQKRDRDTDFQGLDGGRCFGRQCSAWRYSGDLEKSCRKLPQVKKSTRVAYYTTCTSHWQVAIMIQAGLEARRKSPCGSYK